MRNILNNKNIECSAPSRSQWRYILSNSKNILSKSNSKNILSKSNSKNILSKSNSKNILHIILIYILSFLLRHTSKRTNCCELQAYKAVNRRCSSSFLSFSVEKNIPYNLRNILLLLIVFLCTKLFLSILGCHSCEGRNPVFSTFT